MSSFSTQLPMLTFRSVAKLIFSTGSTKNEQQKIDYQKLYACDNLSAIFLSVPTTVYPSSNHNRKQEQPDYIDMVVKCGLSLFYFTDIRFLSSKNYLICLFVVIILIKRTPERIYFRCFFK